MGFKLIEIIKKIETTAGKWFIEMPETVVSYIYEMVDNFYLKGVVFLSIFAVVKQKTMLDRLQIVKQRFDEISDLIIQPDVIADQKRYVALNQEYKTVKALKEKRDEYVILLANIDEANEIISDNSDADMTEMAKMQLDEAKGRLPELEDEIKFMLIPKDAEDAKNVMVEVRAGTGGDEASIFAGDLFRMYTKYCEGKGWRTSVVDMNEGTSGGFKEVIFEVTGEDVYGTLKFEAGVKLKRKVECIPRQRRLWFCQRRKSLMFK
jgi:peptide chain release factor 1